MKSITKWIFASSVVLIILSAHFFYPKWQQSGSEAVISWDVFGYYLYLPATFIYKDLSHLAFVDDICEQYDPTGGPYQLNELENGNKTGQYSIGWSVIHLPAFLIGHFVAKLTAYPTDGYSKPYQIAIAFYGIILSLMGVFLSYLNLKRFYPEKIVMLSIILLLLATNALNYFAIDTAHTHGPLFFLYSVLIYCSISWHDKFSYLKSISIGLIIGLMMIIRPTEIIAFLIPILWGIKDKESLKNKVNLFVKHKGLLLITFISFLLFPVLQVIYWKTITGQFFFYSYVGQTFSWFHPHITDVLLSFRKGWWIYTPFAILFVIGLIPLYRQQKQLFFVVVVFFFINFYIVSAWDIWWYGGSLGQRALVQSYALLLITIPPLLLSIRKSKILLVGMLIFLCFSISHNINLHYRAHSKAPFEAEQMTKAFFLRTYLEFNENEEWLKLLDTPFIFEDEPKNSVALDLSDTIRLSIDHIPFSDSVKIKLPYKLPYLRIYFDAISPKVETYYWNMPQIHCVLINDNDVQKNYFLRLHRFMHPNETKEMYFDVRLLENTNAILLYLSAEHLPTKIQVEIDKIECFKEN